ncbi:MAG: hypothetical protein AAGI30_09505 [Planctomycetota bacterium]
MVNSKADLVEAIERHFQRIASWDFSLPEPEIRAARALRALDADVAASFVQQAIELKTTPNPRFGDCDRSAQALLIAQLEATGPGRARPFLDEIVDRQFVSHDFVLIGASPAQRERISSLYKCNGDEYRYWVDVEGLLSTHTTGAQPIDEWESLWSAGWVPQAVNGRWQKRDLFLRCGCELVPCEKDDRRAAVSALGPLTGEVAEKANTRRYLIEIDLTRPPGMALEIDGSRLRIPLHLSDHKAVEFWQLSVDGDATPLSQLSTATEFYQKSAEQMWVLGSWRLIEGDHFRSPYESSQFLHLVRSSNCGGYIAWDQDPVGTRCPLCEQYMLCIARVQANDLGGAYRAANHAKFNPLDDRSYYGLLCPACLVGATIFQGT